MQKQGCPAIYHCYIQTTRRKVKHNNGEVITLTMQSQCGVKCVC